MIDTLCLSHFIFFNHWAVIIPLKDSEFRCVEDLYEVIYIQYHPQISPCGILANILDYDIVLREFNFQLRYYILFQTNTFWKGMNHLISPAIIPLLSFYKDDFGIK